MVDFPAPLGPRRQKSWFSAIVNHEPLMAQKALSKRRRGHHVMCDGKGGRVHSPPPGVLGAGTAEAAHRPAGASGDVREDLLEAKHLDRVAVGSGGAVLGLRRQLVGETCRGKKGQAQSTASNQRARGIAALTRAMVEKTADLGLLLCDVIIQRFDAVLRDRYPVAVVGHLLELVCVVAEAWEPIAGHEEIVERPVNRSSRVMIQRRVDNKYTFPPPPQPDLVWHDVVEIDGQGKVAHPQDNINAVNQL